MTDPIAAGAAVGGGITDRITIGAAVGWRISAVGWLVSPIISRVLNKGFVHLDFNASEKLKIVDTQVLRLQRAMEVVDESTYRVRLAPLLDKLRSAFYEAEDILDRVEYQSFEKQIQDAKSSGSKMPSSPLQGEENAMSKLQLEKSLKKIESAISDACKVLEQLNLPGVKKIESAISNDNRRRAVATNSQSAGITVGPWRVIGRDQDRDMIIAMLHEKHDQCQANTVSGTSYSVIGIHGIAGSGKSTLARCVYDHEKKHKQEKMEGHFDIIMWIYVSQKFALDSIFSEMFEGATQEKCPKFSSLNVLKESLEEKLRGKRILLVLDDVWYNIRNSTDREELQKLISPLRYGKAGSKILVTSRTEAALVSLGAVKERCIPISELDDKVFLEMFKHYALRDARVGDNDRRILEMIAEDIAKQLKRSPLAARTVGSRLCETPTVEFWSERDQDLLSSTMGALWWSYQYPDEQVRRCFAYCSIFPRGYHLKRDELVKLWVAEGFIKTSNPQQEMEDVAKNYFNELVSSSFLQLGGKERTSYRDLREVDYFTVHDLLCDLAEEVAGRDCFRIEKGCTREVPEDVRYLFVGSYDREMLMEKISGLHNLRSLIFDEEIRFKPTEEKLFADMFTKLTGLQKLRVLKIGVSYDRVMSFSFSLPDYIAQWKHLRYLAFVESYIELTLPGAFTKLYHMQVVDFGICVSLAFSSGEDMMNLVNLRSLISSAAPDIPNLGRMTWLQLLPFFTIRKEQGYEPHQLKHLNKLQGKLEIHGLENVKSKEEALEANLAAKEKLTELELVWNNDSCTPEVQAKVLEGLCPSRYLERLDIRRYQGRTLPNWMMGGHNGGPNNLQELVLAGWSQQGPAPDLGPFIHLHSLHLDRSSWDALPDMEHLTSLKKLDIWGCENMQSLGTLPKSLEEFTVAWCSFDALPDMEHLTSLKKLCIIWCENMRSLGTLPKSLEKFMVFGCNPEFERLRDDYWYKSRNN